METKPRKYIIKKIDEYSIHVEGDNTYQSAKSRAEAVKIGKEMLKEEQERWNKYFSEKAKQIEKERTMLHTLKNYPKVLRRDFDYLFKDKNATPQREDILEIIKTLKLIAEGKSDYSSFSGHYFLVPCKEEEE